MVKLLKAIEVDELLRYSAGKTLRLAKAGKIPFVRLPDGSIRFEESAIQKILKSNNCHKKVSSLGLGESVQ